jgi:hypothetical protein
LSFPYSKFVVCLILIFQLQDEIKKLKEDKCSDEIKEYENQIKRLRSENEDKKIKYLMLNNRSREDLNKAKTMLNEKIEKLEKNLEVCKYQKGDFNIKLKAAEANFMQRNSKLV